MEPDRARWEAIRYGNKGAYPSRIMKRKQICPCRISPCETQQCLPYVTHMHGSHNVIMRVWCE